MSRLDHPIFHGPLPVDLDIQNTPTPPGYVHYAAYDETVPESLPTIAVLKKEWDPLHLPVGSRPDNGEPGLVTSDIGFLDSPDTEVITGGIHLKGPKYIAIGRQGHVLQWGFYGAPEEMTETGRRLFINAVHYIARFKHAPILALRETPPRDSVALTFNFLDEYGPERVGGVLERLLGKNVPPALAGDLSSRKEWFLANRPYLAYEGTLYDGHYFVDEDVRALGVPNYDTRLLSAAIEELDHGGHGGRAQRVLERYTGLQFRTAAEWRRWLDENRDAIYFSDWYGYKFHSSRASAPADAATAAAGPQPVRFDLIAYRRGDEVIAQLKVKIDPKYHIYAPNTKTPQMLAFNVRPASNSPFELASPVVIPQPNDGNISGHFTVELHLKGKGETVSLAVDYQACTEQFCLRPVRGAEVSRTIG